MTSSRVVKLIQKLERGITKSTEFLEILGHSKWGQPISDEDGAWTVKDLVGHLITSENYLLEIARDIASGGEGAPKDLDIDKINQDDVKRFPRISTIDLLNLLRDTRRTTIEWVRELDDTTLDLTGRHPTLGTSSVEMVIFSIYAHQLLHMRESISNFKGE